MAGIRNLFDRIPNALTGGAGALFKGMQGSTIAGRAGLFGRGSDTQEPQQEEKPMTEQEKIKRRRVAQRSTALNTPGTSQTVG